MGGAERLLHLTARALLIVLLGTAAAARGDVFSPGPLSKGHANLEGLGNCTRCHEAGARVSERRCLACHAEIQESVAKKQGFHGRLSDAERTCNLCHHEHQGRDFKLVDWGKGGKAAFDHSRTGFVLAGKHAQIKCEQCHQDRLIGDPEIRKLREAHPERQTYLGVPTTCSGCHFDEHRAQLRDACADCHTERGWKPAPKFNHARTDYALRGKHASVQCAKCHAREEDPDFAEERASFPAPLSETFSRFKPVAHSSCLDCHEDPHANRFGESCETCHSEQGWLVLRGDVAQRAFHETTRFPLRGAHATVSCNSCHGPFAGHKAVFKGLRFDRCTSCHVDAHLGQLRAPRNAPAECDRCHTVQGFRPPQYEVQDHTRWALLGAHAAVACDRCHRVDKRLAERAATIRAWLEKRKRKDEISLVQFHPEASRSRCDVCHADPHGGQFRKRVQKAGCSDCHEVASWTAVRFDHDRETRFPLTGAHENRPCASCHLRDGSGVVRYTSLATDCASCHADVHAGQFASGRVASVDCTECHSVVEFKRTSFQHRRPFTSFELTGKHASVACSACHRDVAVGRSAKVTRYRGLPLTCEGCHVDVHRGAFRGFEP
ncbi:MAG: hypothetical protein ACJ79O_24190 [Myxococcales bacterium]